MPTFDLNMIPLNTLETQFEASLKEYKGKNASLLAFDVMIPKLHLELPRNFSQWMHQESCLAPIAKVAVEVDESGYVYTCLYNEHEGCMLSEGASPDLEDLGLSKLYKKSPTLVTQFLTLCYQKVLSEACKTPEFLSLPRAAEIVFSVGEHAGWGCEAVYVFTGERYEINHGNILLKRLNKATSCHTEPGTLERAFMDHLQSIDIQECANELFPVFQELWVWLNQQNPRSVRAIAIAWSSNFNKDPAIGAYCENDVLHRFPGSVDIYKWFSADRPADLDHDDMVSVRYCVSNKIAEIACLMMERVAELEIFKAIPKQDGFIMKVANRTAGSPPVFYRKD
jgi:hypothetical protein